MTNFTPQQLDLRGTQRLAAAVLIHAAADAIQGNAAAIYWLFTHDAFYYSGLAGKEDTRPLVKLARRCTPGNNTIIGRFTADNFIKALANE